MDINGRRSSILTLKDLLDQDILIVYISLMEDAINAPIRIIVITQASSKLFPFRHMYLRNDTIETVKNKTKFLPIRRRTRRKRSPTWLPCFPVPRPYRVSRSLKFRRQTTCSHGRSEVRPRQIVLRFRRKVIALRPSLDLTLTARSPN